MSILANKLLFFLNNYSKPSFINEVSCQLRLFKEMASRSQTDLKDYIIYTESNNSIPLGFRNLQGKVKFKSVKVDTKN